MSNPALALTTKKMLFALAITTALFITAAPAVAKTPIIPEACRLGGSGCNICYMGVGLNNLTDFLTTTIAFPLAALMFAVGGIVLLVAGPSESLHTLGKKILTSTLIGIIIVAVSWLAVDTIIKVLTDKKQLISNFGPWNQLKEADVKNCPL